MDFDHVRGTKTANVADLVRGPTARLLAELALCDLVCAACHRVRTRDRRLDAHVDAAEGYDVLANLAEV